MSSQLRCVAGDSLVVGWDFSTGGVKCLAFDLAGKVVAESRLPTDLWHGDPVEPGLNELNLMQLEGQAMASTRQIAAQLQDCGRFHHWVAAGISATHHTAGRIDSDLCQVRRAICWNDHTLASFHRKGLKRLGGQKRCEELIRGPWAIRYSLSHLVKDEETLPEEDWKRTFRILPHGPLAAGYLTGNFDVTSVSSAASTGMMDLQTKKWKRGMLDALASPAYRKLAWKQLPRIVDATEAIGPLSEPLSAAVGIPSERRPLIFPTSDDQQAGLIGGGAVDDGHVAVILGNSAVVNSSSKKRPAKGNLDVMRLNWGPYLWMRCYNNGAQFLDRVVGNNPNWVKLEAAGRKQSPAAAEPALLPFVQPEPSLKIGSSLYEWLPSEPKPAGVRYRVALEALAYLIALGVKEHEDAGQKITQVTVSGGIARSDLMCEILASVLNKRLERLESDEGPALGAAVTALHALEVSRRRAQGIDAPYEIGDAVQQMVRFKQPIDPNPAWIQAYQKGLKAFGARVKKHR